MRHVECRLPRPGRGASPRRGFAARRGWRRSSASVSCAIGPVVDVDEAEIVILAVGAAAFRVVVILEPMQRRSSPGGRRNSRSPRRRRRRARPGCATVIRWPLLRLPVRFSVAAKNHSETSTGLPPDSLSQSVEEIARDPAVAGIGVVVGGDRVDMAAPSPDRGRIVVDRQPVAEIERVGVGGPDRLLGQRVVALGDEAGPFAHRGDAVAARRAYGSPPSWRAGLPMSRPGGRQEIGGEPPPIVAVMLRAASRPSAAW